MGRRRSTDLRRVFDAIQYMLASGCQWRLIPPCYPPFSTELLLRMVAGRRSGRMHALREQARRLSGRLVQPTAAVNSQSVKTTESGGPSGYDAGKRINGRKRHLTVTEGSPIVLAVHSADVQDRDAAADVIGASAQGARGLEGVCRRRLRGPQAARCPGPTGSAGMPTPGQGLRRNEASSLAWARLAACRSDAQGRTRAKRLIENHN